MENLASVGGLMIRQQKEWGEILTGFETRNKYAVMAPSGNTLCAAVEVGGSFMGRNLLRSRRAFTVQVVSLDGSPLLRLERPFRFYYHKVDVFDAQEALLGSIQRRFSWARRIYSVLDAAGTEAFELFGPILHPWTFEIRHEGREIGKITKRWSGLLKEVHTDADNFGITFPADLDVSYKGLLLGAVFLIDFVHFEEK